MVVLSFYNCVSALVKYRSYQKIIIAIALYDLYLTSLLSDWIRINPNAT